MAFYHSIQVCVSIVSPFSVVLVSCSLTDNNGVVIDNIDVESNKQCITKLEIYN